MYSRMLYLASAQGYRQGRLFSQKTLIFQGLNKKYFIVFYRGKPLEFESTCQNPTLLVPASLGIFVVVF